ncbi:hypothetical protein FFF34_002075 [Inquilinus sp. KBS0705]|nr:hypothetical protein FFF34_002075 [Inquilinus sp. KBS0705]
MQHFHNSNRPLTSRLLFLALKVFICLTPLLFSSNLFAQTESEDDEEEEEISVNWEVFTNDTAAFSVKLPGNPITRQQSMINPKTNSPYLLKMYLVTDTNNMINYLIRYNDFPAGMYLADKQKTFDAVEQDFKAKNAQIKSSYPIVKDGFEGREIRFSIQNYNCIARLILRGNRIYFLLKQNLNTGEEVNDDDEFFSSFTLLPYKTAPLVAYESKEGDFKAKVFEKMVELSATTHEYNSYLIADKSIFSTNPYSGGLYAIDHATISKYYRINNPDSLFKNIYTGFRKYTDTLIKNDTIRINGYRGVDFVLKKKASEDKSRYRVLWNNGDVIFNYAYLSSDEIYTNANNEFYNGITWLKSGKPIDLTSSKAKLITDDLRNSDTTTYNYAHGALSYYHFDKQELPYIYNALAETYKDDTLYTGTRHKLLTVLEKVNDDKTINELVNLYKKTDVELLKTKALAAIPAVDWKQGLDIYLNLLLTEPKVFKEYSNEVFSPLYDSLSYAAINYDKILALFKYPEYKKNILRLTRSILGDERIPNRIQLIKSRFRKITEFANSDLAIYLKKDSSNLMISEIYSYLQIMNSIKAEPLTDAFTAKIIAKDTYDGEIADAVITRLNNNLPVNQLVLNKALDNISNRYAVLEALSQNGKLLKANPKFITPIELGKTFLYKYVVDDEEYTPDKITLIGTIVNQNKLYYAYKFIVPDDGDNKEYIGIAGPLKKVGQPNFNNQNAYTQWEEKGSNWQEQAKKMIAKLAEINSPKSSQ